MELEIMRPGVKNTMEGQLERSGKLAMYEAHNMSVKSQSDYEQAGSFLVEIKRRAKQIKHYWAKPKAAAKEAHQAVVEREKEMLTPLSEAESIIKSGMLQYQAAVERAWWEAEAAARRLQREEADRLLAEAVAAADKGEEKSAAIGMAMAEMVEEMAPPVLMQTLKAAGISASRTWKARVVDEQAVPAYANGMELRKINLTALNDIAKMTKGTAQILGIEFYQEITISARS